MSQESHNSLTEITFKDFLLKDKRNRTILWIAAAAILIEFAVFKYFYPFASFIHGDSFSYINAADKNLTINTYLIGYSKFLRLFSVFAKPDYILVAFQYLFIQCSVLFLLFSLFYFYRPGRAMQIILLSFMVFNPLFLHLGNLVSSDGFFLALSCIWLALLQWIILLPSKKIIIWHAIVIVIAFTVRYNAMIYPFISGIAFWMSHLTIRKKIMLWGVSILLCGLFVSFTAYQYKNLTGYWQYSPFSGWQWANNALYAYRYVDIKDRKPVQTRFAVLDKMVRDYFDSTRDIKKFPAEAEMASTFYMWSSGMPLVDYKTRVFKKDTITAELKKWATMGPLFKAYGINIICKYPRHFARYFMWPNMNKYYAPPVEFLENYNSGRSEVTDQAKNWFGYKSRKVRTRMKSNMVWILNFYPILSGIINMVMFCSLTCFILLRGWKHNRVFSKGIILGGAIWIINAAFTILASSAALRFQSFPVTMTIILVCFLLDWMIQLLTFSENSSRVKINNEKNLGYI